MSYCRWSSMNWRCDVYTYEDVMGGWTTHVAGRRRVIPPIPDILGGQVSMAMHRWSGCTWDKESRELVYPSRWRRFVYVDLWCRLSGFWHSRLHMGSLHLIPLRPIGLPFDGETFNDPTPTECADRLEWLRGLGYIVPQYAIDALRSEVLDAGEPSGSAA